MLKSPFFFDISSLHAVFFFCPLDGANMPSQSFWKGTEKLLRRAWNVFSLSWRRSWRFRTRAAFITFMACPAFWAPSWEPSPLPQPPRRFTETGNSKRFLAPTWRDPRWPDEVVTCACASGSMADVFPDVATGDVEPSFQGIRQAISLAVTLGVALLGGLIVGRLTFPLVSRGFELGFQDIVRVSIKVKVLHYGFRLRVQKWVPSRVCSFKLGV